MYCIPYYRNKSEYFLDMGFKKAQWPKTDLDILVQVGGQI